MRYLVDDATGEVLVEVDKALIADLAPFGAGWLAGDQWVLLGSPSGKYDRRILGTKVTIGQVVAARALRDRARSERERSKNRFPRVGPSGEVPPSGSPPSPKGSSEEVVSSATHTLGSVYRTCQAPKEEVEGCLNNGNANAAENGVLPALSSSGMVPGIRSADLAASGSRGSSPPSVADECSCAEEVYYIRLTSPKTGKPLAPIPYRWHRCEQCGEWQLTKHGAKSGKPNQGRCSFCGKPRLRKVAS